MVGWRRLTAAGLAILVGACSPARHASVARPGKAPVTTTGVATTDVVLAPTGDVRPPWRRVFHVPYGAARSELGLKSQPVEAPDYGAQDPSGRWWFIDTAKERIARHSSDGRYLDDVPVPHLGAWDPCIVGQDTFIAIGPRAPLIRGNVVTPASLGTMLNVLYSDGRGCWVSSPDGYAYVTVEGDALMQKSSPWLEPVPGERLTLSATKNQVQLDFSGGRRHKMVLNVRSADGRALRPPELEYAVGPKGELFLLLVTALDTDAPAQEFAGMLTIGAGGEVSGPEALPTLFSDLPGDSSVLHLEAGTDQPSLVVVLEDGVTVYRRD